MPDLDAVIEPLAPLLGDAAVVGALDEIFFQASSRQSFADDRERALFRERWFGRYLGADAAHGFVALASHKPEAARRIVGYVVGALENPAGNAKFSDIAFYRDFAPQCRDFPAHLHVNLHAEFRNQGLGAQLIEAFCAHAFAAMAAADSGHTSEFAGAEPMIDGASPMQEARVGRGVHVVTNARSRNVRFYNQVGFSERARIQCGGDDLVFLGRRL